MKNNIIIVLGANGLVGSGILKTLLLKTNYSIIACGRNESKLKALTNEIKSDKLKTMILDVTDSQALQTVCNEAQLIINCVGPYLKHGADIATATLAANASYIDFANEQSHYNRLQRLDKTAKKKNLVLLTGAGFMPGISSILAMLANTKINELKSIELYYVQKRYREPEKGLGSYMSAILESNFNTVSFENGQLIPMQLGKKKKSCIMPEPFGNTTFDRIPTIDSLILPKTLKLNSFANYMNLGGDVPAIMWKFVRLLKPHKRKWAYRMMEKILLSEVRGSYNKAVKKGIGYECVVKIIAYGKDEKWTAIANFPESGEVATTYLPIISADNLLKGKIKKTGLLTPVDIYEPEEIVKEFSEIGFPIKLNEEISEISN